MGEVKFGELKGVDRNGNKYFENTEYPFGQHRWVEYKVRPYLCSHVRVCVGGIHVNSADDPSARGLFKLNVCVCPPPALA